MEEKEKVLIITIVLLLIFSVGMTYYKTIHKGDFEVIDTETLSEPIVDIENNE